MSLGNLPTPKYLGALGFDSLAPVSAAVALRAAAQGFKWVGQYVENLTAQTRDGIFAAGLGIAPLTEAITGVPLTDALGAQVGGERGRQLQALGCPATVHLWCDHESPHSDSDSIGYLNARAAATIRAGYGPGQYGGEPFDLSATAFFGIEANRYWRGGGAVPEPECGFCVLQLPPLDQVLFEGQRVDVDIVCEDFHGRLPMMWFAA